MVVISSSVWKKRKNIRNYKFVIKDVLSNGKE
jgi:hypothetical protein